MTQAQIYRPKDVAVAMGVSLNTVSNWTNPNSRHYRADFPKPFTLSTALSGKQRKAIGFLAREIDDYIAKLAQTRLNVAKE